MQRLLCRTFSLCNFNMRHTKAHDNVALFFRNLSTGHIVAIQLDPWTWHCHLVDALYLKYTFLVEDPHSIIVCSPHWLQCWSTKTWWSYEVNSLKQILRHWFGSEHFACLWSLDFLGPCIIWRLKLSSSIDFHNLFGFLPPFVSFLFFKMTIFVAFGIHSNGHG